MRDVNKIANEIAKLNTEEIELLNNVLLTNHGMSSAIYRYTNTIFDETLLKYSVYLLDTTHKLMTVKTLKELFGLGLRDAKNLVDGMPSLLISDVSKEVAEGYELELERVGCEIDII